MNACDAMKMDSTSFQQSHLRESWDAQNRLSVKRVSGLKYDHYNGINFQ